MDNVAFPAILARTLALIGANANREVDAAIIETMDALQLSTKDGWRADLASKQFVKIEEKPPVKKQRKKKRGGGNVP